MTYKASHITQTVYEFIADYIAENDIAPTIREIADNCYIGRSTVVRHLDRLEASGRIVREIGQHRSIRII